MKKNLLLFIAIIFSVSITHAQFEDVGPIGTENRESNALFDLLFTHDIGLSIGANGQAGVIYFDGEYWISAWASNLIHVLDSNGSYVETFNIAGVTGTRSMTTDGTNIYIGTAGSQIYIIDPETRMLDGTINISTTSSALARMLTYDETLDGGSGGFWIGDFSNDIASVDMNGNELSVIPAATHGTIAYGGAVDNVSPDGPFLWVFDQTGAIPSRAWIVQLELPSGSPTGVIYDYTADGMGAGAFEVLAGGLFISDEVTPSTVTMIGLCQCTPSNLVFGLELVATASISDNVLAGFSFYPNPSTDIINVTSKATVENISIYNLLGQELLNVSVNGLSAQIDISGLSAGMYVMKATVDGTQGTFNFVKR